MKLFLKFFWAEIKSELIAWGIIVSAVAIAASFMLAVIWVVGFPGFMALFVMLMVFGPAAYRAAEKADRFKKQKDYEETSK